jgi:hypothetical protein
MASDLDDLEGTGWRRFLSGVLLETRQKVAWLLLAHPAEYSWAALWFERFGRDALLERYGFGPAVSYFVQVEDRLYDSKALAGVAHGYARPELGALTAADFSGGEATVKRHLNQLGAGFRLRASGHPARRGSRADAATSLPHLRLRSGVPHGPRHDRPIGIALDVLLGRDRMHVELFACEAVADSNDLRHGVSSPFGNHPNLVAQ